MARITMKLFLILLVLISNTTLASFTPLSGTFSNAARGINTISFNLIVTVNEQGQQVSLQCLSDGNAGFWHNQTSPKARTNISLTSVNELFCPASEVEISLDYEEAYLKYNGIRVGLNRGPIYVPIED
jgi:hypothetical protein